MRVLKLTSRAGGGIRRGSNLGGVTGTGKNLETLVLTRNCSILGREGGGWSIPEQDNRVPSGRQGMGGRNVCCEKRQPLLSSRGQKVEYESLGRRNGVEETGY